LKVLYNRYRLRKYSAIDKDKQAQTQEMLEAQPVTELPQETKEEIPFGIRAIQSGIEIDGVWISRSNTPVGSSRASVISDKVPRSYNNSQLELPKSALLTSSRDSSRAPSSFDRAVSAERINDGSRSTSPAQGGPSSNAGRYSTSSYNVGRNSAVPAHDSPSPVSMSSPPSRKYS